MTKAGKAELILLRFIARYFYGPTKQKEHARITAEQLIKREEGRKHKKYTDESGIRTHALSDHGR